MNKREKARRKAVKTPRALRARRCKDCVSYSLSMLEECRIPCNRNKPQDFTAWHCFTGNKHHYTRKRWKFWRPK